MFYLPSAYKTRAEKITILFLDENKIPARFRPNSKTKRFKEDSKIEINFQSTVQEWVDMITNMMERGFPRDLVHQLIYLQVPDLCDIVSVTDLEDWREYMDYLSYLRDKHDDDVELGRFSMIFKAWEDEVERKLSRSKGLKDDLAQELLEKGEIELDGHVIKLWRGHSRDTVSIQENWNKVISIGALNMNKPTDSPRLVLTGMFQIPRAEVAAYASEMGFRVQSKVTKQTQYVVFGSENVSPNKISDLIKLRQEGYPIELMEENAFLEMVLGTLET